MGRLVLLSSVWFLAVASAAGQQLISVPPSPPGFYYNDGGVTLPGLLPAGQAFPSHHCRKKDRLLVLGAVVDEKGVPHQLTVLRSAGSDVDAAALAYASAERLKPGFLNGEPVAVAVEMELQVQTCKQKSPDPGGKIVEQTVLAGEPAQFLEEMPPPLPDPNITGLQLSQQTSIPGVEHVGAGITAPRPLNAPAARFSDAARKFKIQGSCLVQMVVDTQGEPKNIHLVRSLEPSLDEQAIKAVEQYRFKPALKEGKPVPVLITIEITFRLY